MEALYEFLRPFILLTQPLKKNIMKHKVTLNSSGVNPRFLKKMNKAAPIFIVLIVLALIIPGFLLCYSGFIYYKQHVNTKTMNGPVVHHEHGSENTHHDKKIAPSKNTHGCVRNSEGNYVGKICTKSLFTSLLGLFLILAGLYLSIMPFIAMKK